MERLSVEETEADEEKLCCLVQDGGIEEITNRINEENQGPISVETHEHPLSIGQEHFDDEKIKL